MCKRWSANINIGVWIVVFVFLFVRLSERSHACAFAYVCVSGYVLGGEGGRDWWMRRHEMTLVEFVIFLFTICSILCFFALRVHNYTVTYNRISLGVLIGVS